MSAPTHNFGKSQDPFADFADLANKNFLYALTEETIKQLESGILKGASGEPMQLRKITRRMLQENRGLAAEINLLATQGYLGFAGAGHKNHISFRKDLAEKIGNKRTFEVVDQRKPEKLKTIDAEITGVDEHEYMGLAEHIHLTEADDKEAEAKTEAEHKKHDEMGKVHHHRAAAAPGTEKVFQKQPFIVDQGVSSVLQQRRAEEDRRRERAAEDRQAEAKREREEVKREDVKQETLKREIRNAEISHGEKVSSHKRHERINGEEIDVSPKTSKHKGVPAAHSQKVKKRKLT